MRRVIPYLLTFALLVCAVSALTIGSVTAPRVIYESIPSNDPNAAAQLHRIIENTLAATSMTLEVNGQKSVFNAPNVTEEDLGAGESEIAIGHISYLTEGGTKRYWVQQLPSLAIPLGPTPKSVLQSLLISHGNIVRYGDTFEIFQRMTYTSLTGNDLGQSVQVDNVATDGRFVRRDTPSYRGLLLFPIAVSVRCSRCSHSGSSPLLSEEAEPKAFNAIDSSPTIQLPVRSLILAPRLMETRRVANGRMEIYVWFPMTASLGVTIADVVVGKQGNVVGGSSGGVVGPIPQFRGGLFPDGSGGGPPGWTDITLSVESSQIATVRILQAGTVLDEMRPVAAGSVRFVILEANVPNWHSVMVEALNARGQVDAMIPGQFFAN